MKSLWSPRGRTPRNWSWAGNHHGSHEWAPGDASSPFNLPIPPSPSMTSLRSLGVRNSPPEPSGRWAAASDPLQHSASKEPAGRCSQGRNQPLQSSDVAGFSEDRQGNRTPLLPHEPVIWRVVLAAKPRLQGRPPAPITHSGAHLPAGPWLLGGWGGETREGGGDGVLPPTCREQSGEPMVPPGTLPGILSRQEPCLVGKQRRNRATPGHLGADGRALSPAVLPDFRCFFIQQGSGTSSALRWWSIGPGQALRPEPTPGSPWTLVSDIAVTRTVTAPELLAAVTGDWLGNAKTGVRSSGSNWELWDILHRENNFWSTHPSDV